MEKLYSIQEVADKLNLSAKTLRRWEEAGRFAPSRTLGGQRRYSVEDLQVLDAIKHGTIPDQKDLLTLAQAAAFFGVSPATVDRWENEGKIHPLITAGNTYYPRSRLVAKMGELQTEIIPDEPVSLPVPQTPKPSSPPEEIKPRLQPLQHQPQSTIYDLRPMISINSIVLNAAVTLVLLTGYYFLTRPFPVVSPAGGVAQSTLADQTSSQLADLGRQFHDYVAVQMQKDAKSTSISPVTTGTSTMPKGKAQVSVPSVTVTPQSPVVVTFTSDYSPAKKYWITADQGSFTLKTDVPVASDSAFTYLIGPTAAAPPSATPTPAVPGRAGPSHS